MRGRACSFWKEGRMSATMNTIPLSIPVISPFPFMHKHYWQVPESMPTSPQSRYFQRATMIIRCIYNYANRTVAKKMIFKILYMDSKKIYFQLPCTCWLQGWNCLLLLWLYSSRKWASNAMPHTALGEKSFVIPSTALQEESFVMPRTLCWGNCLFPTLTLTD